MGLIARAAVLQNEVKAWPPLIQIGAGFDLVTNNHWWDDEGTPTTKATAVPSSGEAGLDAKFTEVIKCVTDAADEGFNQRYTYADEPRIKSGSVISALIWVATTAGGSGITVKLRNSGGSSTTATSVASDGDWILLCVEEHTCSGTYVELVVTKDASGTFYAGGSMTVMVGADVIALPPRGLVLRTREGTSVKSLSGIGDEDTWTDVDCTSATSNLAAVLVASCFLFETTSGSNYQLYVRRNGSTTAKATENRVNLAAGVLAQVPVNDFQIILDDDQIFEYLLDRDIGSSALDSGAIQARGYWEWE